MNSFLQKIRTSKAAVAATYGLLAVILTNADGVNLQGYLISQIAPSMQYKTPQYVSDSDVLHSAAEDTQKGLFASTVYPVTQIPNWGAMRTPAKWNRTFEQLTQNDLVSVPAYNLDELTQPLRTMLRPLNAENIRKITAKLFYSTRYFGSYHLDSGELEAIHPGMDLKLAEGTPIGAIAGGTVQTAGNDRYLGLHIIISHVLPTGEKVFSIYGHLSESVVAEGDSVAAGQMIARSGSSGQSSAPHLHLQIDRDNGNIPHTVYWPDTLPDENVINEYTIHPIQFIENYE